MALPASSDISFGQIRVAFDSGGANTDIRIGDYRRDASKIDVGHANIASNNLPTTNADIKLSHYLGSSAPIERANFFYNVENITAGGDGRCGLRFQANGQIQGLANDSIAWTDTWLEPADATSVNTWEIKMTKLGGGTGATFDTANGSQANNTFYDANIAPYWYWFYGGTLRVDFYASIEFRNNNGLTVTYTIGNTNLIIDNT